MFDWLKEWIFGIASQVLTMPVYTAAPMMIIVGLLDSSLLSLPEVNDYITISRIAQHPDEVYYFPLFPAIGSVIGCLILYGIVRRGEQFIVKRFHPSHMEWAESLYRRWGVLALVIPALLPPPMPFKIFVAMAGALEYPAWRFTLVVLISRLVRYYSWGIAAYFWRDQVLKAQDALKEHFFEVLGIMLAAIALFFIVRWVLSWFKSRSLKDKTEASYTD